MGMKVLRGRFSGALIAAGMIALGAGVSAAAVELQVDINDRTPTDGSATDSGTQPGFAAYDYLNNAIDNVGPGHTMVVSGIGGIVDDRDRNFSYNASTLTYAEVYDDFIFNNSNTGSLTVTITGFEPSTQYQVSLYAYDHGSPGVRSATWLDQNNGGALVTNVSFEGGVVPTTNDTYKYTGLAMTDENGMLSLRGNNASPIPPSGTYQGVFLSGLEVAAVPEPTAAVSLLGLAGLLITRRRRR
jgi:hypothetical protein